MRKCLCFFSVLGIGLLSSCQFKDNARYLALQGQLIEAEKTVRQYEERYGKLRDLPRTEADVRALQLSLPGKTMNEVLPILGKPSQLFEVDGRESWLYRDIVFDSVTKRMVKNFELWFVGGKVTEVTFSY